MDRDGNYIENPERIDGVGCIWSDPLGPYIPIVWRRCWGAREPVAERTTPLATPVRYLRFTDTGTDMSFWPRAQEELQEVQDDQMDQGLPDIAYNFMIAADGTLFEGRGWRVEADRPAGLDHLKGKCLDIAYIGDFRDQLPPWLMMNVGVDLIKYGVRERLIDPLFETIPYTDRSYEAIK